MRDGVALSAAEAERQISELMPAEIEQFFLFDGELLDQYEKLVDDDNTAGATLREAIERILGIPVLTNAVRDAQSVADAAGKLIVEAAQRDKETKRLGDALASQQVIVQEHRANANREDENIRKYSQELSTCDQEIAEQRDKIELKAKRDQLYEQAATLKEKLAEAESTFQERLSDAWRAVLVDPIQQHIATAERELDDLGAELNDLRFAATLAARWHESGKDTCPVCAQRLGADGQALVGDHVVGADAERMAALESETAAIRHRVRVLRELDSTELRADLRTAENAFRQLTVELDDLRSEIEEKNEQLLAVEGDDLDKLVKRRGDVKALLDRATQTYEVEDQAYRDARARAESLSDQIRKHSGGQADPSVQAQAELASKLVAMFEQAIVMYRDRMKEDVQDAASSIFTAMRSEPDFVKLTINESYGLRILDRLGRPVQGRSAGYEHIVALSLLGALQQCSPITGPIVMDSPFGRLDDEHVSQVVSHLDQLSNQVFLLVHERELSRDDARRLLRTQLLTEFELQRIDSHETRIEEVRQ
jgi:DNA sulfur modification protein DndD